MQARSLFLFLLALLATHPASLLGQTRGPWCGIRIVDEETGQGVPLVELESTHSVRWVSDNAGCIYIDEMEFMDQSVFFFVHGHGYEVKKDGFGYAGVKVSLKRDSIVEVKVKRTVPAERMVRLTGSGLLRDANLSGFDASEYQTPLNGQVVGQDSIQAIPWEGKVLCIWGDTSKAGYPLGLFRAAGAFAPLSSTEKQPYDPSKGIPYQYFIAGEQGFVRAMMPLPERKEGVVWLDGLTQVKDESSQPHVIAHYSRRAGLADELEHGIAILDAEKMEFRPLHSLNSLKEYRHPYGHAQLVIQNGKEWAVFGNPFPNLRVPATLNAIQDPSQYEVLTPLEASQDKVELWGWKKNLPRFSAMDESGWLEKNKGSERSHHFLPANIEDKTERIIFHNGSFSWNKFRKKWIILGGRWLGKDSLLGEVWYTEADNLEGPYMEAVKVATHVKQSFYNVCHHPFWDQQQGRILFFEGTFTADFSGNPYKTPRYNYNQILYRLDLEKLFSK
jgi:hypothetical protein